MRAGAHVHQINVTRELFSDIILPVFDKILEAMHELIDRHGKNDAPLTLHVTHRAGSVFNLEEIQNKLPDAKINIWDTGCAALGALHLANEFETQVGSRLGSKESVSLLSSRSWITGAAAADKNPKDAVHPGTAPTHLLCESLAYPITDTRPLIVEKMDTPNRLRVYVKDDGTALPKEYVSLERQGETINLVNCQSDILRVDGKKVADTIRLNLGQQIQIGDIKEQLRLIAYKDGHET
jgi:hypothetical protein